MDPQRKGWVRLQDGTGETSSSSSISSSSSSTTTTTGKKTPPPQSPKPSPKAPKKKPRRFESSEEEPPPPPPLSPAEQAQGQGQAPSQGQGQRPPPPNPKPLPCKIGVGTPMGMCRVWGTPGMSLGGRGAMGGTVSQVTVLGDWDEELDPGEWLVVSQGSNGEREGGKKGKKGKERRREKEGGTFRVPGELLFRTREEAEAHLREALGAGTRGTKGMTGMTKGMRVVTRGVRWGVTRGGIRTGTRGVRRGVPGARMSPGNPEGGVTCMSRLANGGLGGGREANGANRANRANPPPSDPAPARQVTFQVTCGVRWGANRANPGVGGGGTRRSVSGVQHRDLMIGHGWPW